MGAAEEALDRALAGLAAAEVAVAVLRDPARDGRGALEADVLVDPAHRVEAEAVLVAGGFRRRPGWGRHPHRFFVRPATDGAGVDWLKLDLVTDLCFGPRHEWPTGLGAACLGHRRGSLRPRLAPADELVAHLLHALLDRRELRPGDHSALARAAAEADGPGILARELTEPGRGPASFDGLVGAVRDGRWDAVVASAPALRRVVARRHPLRGSGRRSRSLVLRRASVLLRPLDGPGGVVAVVGPDGAGKSTLVSGLVASVGPLGPPARALYGGTYRRGNDAGVPGLATARVASRLLATRIQLGWHRRLGRLVVLDRHPEQARPAPGDVATRRARLRRTALATTLPDPDLVLVLDAPAEILHARRPEHPLDRLDRDRTRHRDLRLSAPTHVLDATATPGAVLTRAVELVWCHAVAGGPVPATPGARP